MQITILNYEPNERNLRQGFVDIRIIHDANRSEIFRGLGYFVKGDRSWISLQNVNRDGKWLPTYERTPALRKEIFVKALEALDQYMMGIRPSAFDSE